MHRYLPKNAKSVATPGDIELCQRIWPALATMNPTGASQYIQLAAFAKQQRNELSNLSSLSSQDSDRVLTSILDCIQASQSSSRQEVAQRVADVIGVSTSSTPDREQLQRALEIGATLYLTMNISSCPSTSVSWEASGSLTDAISFRFELEPEQASDGSDGIIDPKLTVSNLVTNYGIVVDWTNYLDEHLRFDEENKVLAVYQHKLWLSAHLDAPDQCAIHPEVLGECLDTLNLLFPHHDSQTRSFLREQGQNFSHLGSCSRAEKRNLRDYPRWAAHIEDLLAVLDGPRKGYRQLLPRPDQRNLLDSVNFWIAVLVAVLAATSFVFGLLAVIYAKMSYDVSKEALSLTRDQYLLSLAQACSDRESGETVLQFCQID